MDKNGDGQLSREEVLSGYNLISDGVGDPEETVDKIFLECDANNSGFIDYTEFVAATIDM